MSKATEYRDFMRAVSSTVGYWKSYSLMQFTSSLVRLMQKEKMQGKALAAQLGISATQVSKVLSGQENITVETMAKFAHALDAVVHIHVAKRGVQVQWRELPPAQKETEPVVAPGFSPPDDRTVVKFTSKRKLQELKKSTFIMEPPPELREAYG